MELLKYLDAESDKLHEENISSNDDFRTVNHSFVEGFNYALAIVQGFEIELNSDQQVVLDWLKEEKTNSNLTAFDCIYSFIYGNPKDLVTQIWSELNEKEEGQVLEVFSRWVQEQEE